MAAPAAAAPGGNPYNRRTQHDNRALFNSTARPLWDRIMGEDHIKFNDIQLTDLEGDNSVVLMSTFANRIASNPPISNHTRRPIAASTLEEVINVLVRELKHRFRNVSQNLPDLFPEDEVKAWKKKIKDGRSRIMMEGADDTELFKSTFPIPPEHSARTFLFPTQDFPDPE